MEPISFSSTHESPGFPKQLDDIALALTYLSNTFTQDVTFALFGTSAGAHLSMLSAYYRDTARNVEVIVSHVGPGDRFTNPQFALCTPQFMKSVECKCEAFHHKDAVLHFSLHK